MGRVILGTLLLVVGLGTLVSPDIPDFWIGAVIVGILLIVGGSVSALRERKAAQELSKIANMQEDLVHRLQNKEPIDEIADRYHKENNIPPIRTIQVAAHLIKSLTESDDELAHLFAAYLTLGQIVDSSSEPKNIIESFSFHDRVYYLDDTATMFSKDPKDKRGVSGTLVLDKGFMFFFERKDKLLENPAIDTAVGTLEEIVPALSIATSGYSLVSGLSQELANHFTESRIEDLKERFDYDQSKALPLIEVSRVSTAVRKGRVLETVYLEVVCDLDGQSQQYWFSTSSSDESAWVNNWIERIQLACIAEGHLLV